MAVAVGIDQIFGFVQLGVVSTTPVTGTISHGFGVAPRVILATVKDDTFSNTTFELKIGNFGSSSFTYSIRRSDGAGGNASPGICWMVVG